MDAPVQESYERVFGYIGSELESCQIECWHFNIVPLKSWSFYMIVSSRSFNNPSRSSNTSHQYCSRWHQHMDEARNCLHVACQCV
jgi:hypothetical protein